MKRKGESQFLPSGPLFDPPLARTTDPDTSHQAGKALFESSRMASLQGKLVRMAERFPGRTARELQARYRGEGELWKRVNECVDKRLIYRGQSRRCRITGHMAATLWAVEK